MKKIILIIFVLHSLSCQNKGKQRETYDSYYLSFENNNLRNQIYTIEKAAESESRHLDDLLAYYHSNFPDKFPIVEQKADTVFSAEALYRTQKSQYNKWFDSIRINERLTRDVLFEIMNKPYQIEFELEEFGLITDNFDDTTVLINVFLKNKLKNATKYLKVTIQQQYYPVKI